LVDVVSGTEQEHAFDAIGPASVGRSNGTEETQRICCPGTAEVHSLMQTLRRIRSPKHWTCHSQQRWLISFFWLFLFQHLVV